MKLIIEWCIKRFIKCLGKHYPTYWEITEIYKDGHQYIHHKIGSQYTPQDIEDEISRDIKNRDDIMMIDAERWINVQGLGIRIELENTKISRINKIKQN